MASSGAEGGGIEAVVKRRLHAMGIVGGLNAADGSCMDLNRRVVVLVVLVGVVVVVYDLYELYDLYDLCGGVAIVADAAVVL